MRNRLAIPALAILALFGPISAPKAQQLQSFRVVASCGAVTPFPTPQPGQTAVGFMDVTGKACGSSSGSSTFTWPGTAGLGTGGAAAAGGTTMPYVNSYVVGGSIGGSTQFRPGATAIAATTMNGASQAVSIPAGTTTLLLTSAFTTTNFVHCTIGPTAVVTDQLIPPGVTFPFDATGATQFACITSSGNQIVSAVAGAGAANAFMGIDPTAALAGATPPQAKAIQGIAGGVPVPMSAAALPLPAGAATATNQEVTAAGTTAASAQAFQGVTGGVAAPISAAALPLPAGAATATNQEVTAAGTTASSAQAFQGVTGGIAAPISAAALPLPAGAATAANQEVTAPGTSAGSAQGVQGVTNGVPMNTKSGTYASGGTGQYHQAITSLFTPTVPGGTTSAQICVEGANAYYTDDGVTTPTTSNGMFAPAPSCWSYAGPLANFRIIGLAGAVISLSYYK